MTNEEALCIIYEMIEMNLLTTKENEALRIASNALEKQTAKEPIAITRNAHATKIIGYGCPNCHKDVTGSGFHCWNCGQHLDWSKVK